METTASRTPVDVSQPQAYPGVALVLAILSVPGSILAWDVIPGGGFVIGVPLAVAAVVLGVLARRQDVGKGKSLAAIIIAGLMLALPVVWMVASAF